MKFVLPFFIFQFTLLGSFEGKAAEQGLKNCVPPLQRWLENTKLLSTLKENALYKEDVHIDSPGTNTGGGVYQGKYSGKEVVVKPLRFKGKPGEFESSNSAENIMKEVFLYREVSDLAIAPKLLGVMRFDNGDYGLITEKVNYSWVARQQEWENQDQTAEAVASVSPEIQKEWRKAMTLAVDRLSESGIFAQDLQFLLTPDGEAWLIDVGLFEETDVELNPNVNRRLLQDILSKFPSN